MRGSTAGLADGVLNPKISFHAIWLEILDYTFASFVLAIAVVSYWRGTWNLMDVYLFPDNKLYSASTSLAIGVSGHLFFTGLQWIFIKTLDPNQHRLTYYAVSRFYTICYGVVCVNGWRGLWQLLDAYTPHTIWFIAINVTFSLGSLAFLKALRNISAVPFVCITDNFKEYFTIPTMFKIKVRRPHVTLCIDTQRSSFTFSGLTRSGPLCT